MQRLGEYEIRGEIGRGGFGRVYQGFDPRVERFVAIKVLDEKADPSIVARFRNEAAAAGNLRHKNITTVYGYGEDQGRHFLVMEYLDGRDLQNLIQEKQPLTLLQKVDIMAQVAEGLLCAHLNGVVHRDVKPANIKVLSDGTAKIMDFGIARLMREGASRVTQADQLVGTVAYMAPEQFTGGEVDVFGDIWAYGVILYELLAGTNPFGAAEPGIVMYRVTTVNPEPVRNFYPECPLALERIVERLLAKDRDYRYSSFDDVQYDLVPVLKELQHDFARALLAKATGLVREKRLDEANALARRIFDLDPSNVEAGELRTMIQEETKQRKVKPRIAALIKQAEAEAERRNFPAAVRSLDQAQRLAPNDSQVLECRQRIQSAADQIALAVRMTKEARKQLDQDDLSGALRTITAAIEADHTNAEAQRVLAEIRAGMEAMERKRKLQSDLGRAETLLSIGALAEATDLVDRLMRDHPDSDEALRLSKQLQAHHQEKFRRDQLSASAALLTEGSLTEAVAKLESLRARYPDAADVQHLLSVARDQIAAREKARVCSEVEYSVHDALSSRDFSQALAIVDRAFKSYPDEPSFAALRKTVLEQWAAAERAPKLQAGLARVEEYARRGELNLALGLAESLGQKLGTSEELEERVRRLRAAFEERETKIRDTLQAARQMLEAAQPDPAVELLSGALAKIGEDARLRHFLSRAVIAQQNAARAREVEAARAQVLALEESGNWAACLSAIEEARGKFGSVEILDSIAARVIRKLDLGRWQELIHRNIQDRDWEAGAANLEAALRHYPGETTWQGLSNEVRAGQLKELVEGALQAENLDAASQYLEEAKRLPREVDWLAGMEAGLNRASGIRAQLVDAGAAYAAADYGRAQQILKQLLELEPRHREAQSLLQAAEWEQERTAAMQRKQAALERTTSLLSEERFEDAVATLQDALREAPGDRTLGAAMERASAAQTAYLRHRAIDEVRKAALAEIEEGKPEAAVDRLTSALHLHGQDQGLIEILQKADGLQQEQQCAADIAARISRADACKEKGDWESALQCVEEGLNRHGSVPELEQAASEARAQIQLLRFRRAIEQLIESRSWAAAQSEIESARGVCPQDGKWDEYASQLRLALLRIEIESRFQAGDLTEARKLLAGAGDSLAGQPWLDGLIRELERAERRRDALDQVRHFEEAGQVEEAENVLRRLAGSGFDDPEIAETSQRLAQQREEAERSRRRNEARAEVLRLVEQQNFPSALSAVQDLLQEFPQDQELENDRAGIEAEIAERARKQLAEAFERVRSLAGSKQYDAADEVLQRLAAEGHDDRVIESERNKLEEDRQQERAAIQREEESRRRELFDLVRSLEAGKRFDEADRLIEDFLVKFDDREVRAEQERLLQARAAWERQVHRDTARATAIDLVAEDRLAEAARAVTKLLHEFPGDEQLERDLAEVQAREKREEEERRRHVLDRARELAAEKRFGEAGQLLEEFGSRDPEMLAYRSVLAEEQRNEATRLEQQERYNRARANAEELAKEGKLGEALQAYNTLSMQFPSDDAIQKEIADLEAKQALAQRRGQAIEAVRNRNFELASQLLPPLLKELPEDRELYEMWRVVSTEKRDSNWLDIYEQMQELEELFRKGKALKVKQRALKLLEQTEDSRARGYLTWAEGELAKEPESITEKFKKWL